MLGQPIFDAGAGGGWVSLHGQLQRRRHCHRPGVDRDAKCFASTESSENSWNFTARDFPRLSIPDRATIANMAPEYGATMGFLPR